MNNSNIILALSKLEVQNEDHWTSDGLPRLDVLKALAGFPVTRQMVTSAAPGFSRASTGVLSDAEKPEPAQPVSETVVPVAATPVEEADVPGVEEDVAEESFEDAIVAELAEARAAFHEARDRYNRALEAESALVAKREQENRREKQHSLIKQFQESQARQRGETAAKQAKLNNLLNR